MANPVNRFPRSILIPLELEKILDEEDLTVLIQGGFCRDEFVVYGRKEGELWEFL
jgi:hypothetical protein